MKAILTAVACLMTILVCSVSAVPVTYAHVPKLIGKVIEVNSNDLCMAIRIELDEPYDHDRLQEVHSALRRYTYLGFKGYRRPRHKEALLLFTHDRPKGIAKGDRIEIQGYGVVGHSDSAKKLGSPYYTKVEKLPDKG